MSAPPKTATGSPYAALRAPVLLAAAWLAGVPAAPQEDVAAPPERSGGWELGVEIRAHYRDSEALRTPLEFPFAPEQLRPGHTQGWLETVDAGEDSEISEITLRAGRRWSAGEAFLKVDFRQLHDRNPTSTGHEIDVDEAWVRFGGEAEPAARPERRGGYLKLGKFPAFERQDDRHLESYGLLSTAFNRMEDVGLEAGWDSGSFVYLKASLTQGNPVFMRDPNALAGDNGTPIFRTPNPAPELRSGFVIPYDADVQDLDFEHPESGLGLGARLVSGDGSRAGELLVWGRRRRLAETVELDGTFYGGDLDLLRGPANLFPFPLTDDDKTETGLNLWLYLGGFTFFGQVVDQELGGLPRSGVEGELAWSFDLPLVVATRGRQLFTRVAPALRYSKLDPDFAAPPVTPSPSFAWEWEKLDAGVRLGIIAGLDLTVEVSDNEFVLASGATRSYEETLVTLRYRAGIGR